MRILTPSEILAARRVLGWSEPRLAKEAGLAKATTYRITHGEHVTEESRLKVAAAIEKVGVKIHTVDGRVMLSVPAGWVVVP